jgi:hypothetical protein
MGVFEEDRTMKRWALVVLAVGLAGCSGDSRSNSDRTPAEAKGQREEYRRRAKAELDKLDDQVGNLRTKAKEATGSAKADMEKALDQLKEKRDEAAQRLEELKEEHKGDWDALKRKADKAFNDFEDALGRTRLRFGGK